MLTLHEIINIRPFVDPEVRAGLRNSWHGVCQEVFDALAGDPHHEVFHEAGRYVIYRQGIIHPVFVQSGAGFVNPYWLRRR